MDEVAGPSGSAATRSTHRSHRFRGPQLALRSGEPGILAEAVELSGVFEGRRFVAAVSNRSGHAFPTGFPGRMALLELRGIDGGGREIYRNVSNEPMKQHPDAVFNMGFVAHHMIRFTTEALAGRQNASFYSARQAADAPGLDRAA